MERMNRFACLALLFLAWTTSGGRAEAASPIRLKLEEYTVLRVGQMAVLRVPKGGRYAWPPKSTQHVGTLRETRRSKDALFYRASKAGPDVIGDQSSHAPGRVHQLRDFALLRDGGASHPKRQ